jgi:hypothetical protein
VGSAARTLARQNDARAVRSWLARCRQASLTLSAFVRVLDQHPGNPLVTRKSRSTVRTARRSSRQKLQSAWNSLIGSGAERLLGVVVMERRSTYRLRLVVFAMVWAGLAWLPIGIPLRALASPVAQGKPTATSWTSPQPAPAATAEGVAGSLVGDRDPGVLPSIGPAGRFAIDQPPFGAIGRTEYQPNQGSCSSGYCYVATFSSVSCASPASCIAVGTALGDATLAEGWDGTGWSIEPTLTPTGSTSSTLTGVSCTAASACLAVGYYSGPATGGTLPLAESWDGSSWTIRLPLTPAGGTYIHLNYVQCGPVGRSLNACMAVGDYRTSIGETLPLAEFWDGTSWTIEPPLIPAGSQGAILDGVSCLSATACTTTGFNYVAPISGAYNWVTLAEHWDGSSWSIQTTPNPTGAFRDALSGVWCGSPSFCTAVGQYQYLGNNVPATLAESWDGTSWTIPNTADTGSGLANVSCSSASNCMAVGGSSDGVSAEAWDGTSWMIEPAPSPTPIDFLSDVSCTAANACTAVGATFATSAGTSGAYVTLAERWDGTRWMIQPTPNPSGGGGGGGGGPSAFSVLPNGPGSVSSQPAGIDCPLVSCTATFAPGTSVTLSAVAGTEAVFDQWGGDCASVGSTPSCTLVSSASGNFVSADFASRFAWLSPTPADGAAEDATGTIPVVLKGQYNSSGLPSGSLTQSLSINMPSRLPRGLSCLPVSENSLLAAEVDCWWRPAPSDQSVHDVTFTATYPDGVSGPSLTLHFARARYVALGDSYSAGEGVFKDGFGNWAPYNVGLPSPPGSDASYWEPGTDHDVNNRQKDHCHRSAYAYSGLLAHMGLTPGPPDFHACSGSVTNDFYFPNHQWGYSSATDGKPQLCWLSLDPQGCFSSNVFPYPTTPPDYGITLVTLTDGGNDVGFAPVVQNCVLAVFSDSGCWGQDPKVDQAIANLEPRLVKLLDDIATLAPAARILVAGYPKPFPAGGYNGTCYTFTQTDEQWMNAKAAQLDFAIQQAAFESGVAEYVDAYSIMDRHEVCDIQKQWINGILPPPRPESFHPNKLGQLAYAHAFATQLRARPGYNLTINPEQALDVTFNPAGNGTATFSAQWPGSTIAVTLTAPSGQTFTGPNAAAGVSEVHGPTFDVYRVANPAAGTWTLHLTGVKVAAGGEPVAVRTGQTPPGGVAALAGPSARAMAFPVAGLARLRVRFKVQNVTAGVRYRWLFGDGSAANGSTVSHAYRKVGLYHPALVATSPLGLQTFAPTKTSLVTGAQVSRLRLTPPTFAAASTGPTLLALARRIARLISGTIVSYTQAQHATTAFTVQRPEPGRRQGTRCVSPSKGNRSHRRCTRYVPIGTFRHKDRAGRNRLIFSGRVLGRQLATGDYRLESTPTNSAGTGPTAYVYFHIANH